MQREAHSKQNNLICFVSVLTLPICLCSVTVYLHGLLAVFWLMVENKNIEMITHIVLHLKRDTQGNHQENKKTKNSGSAVITLGYPVLSHGIYQWPPCLGSDSQLLQKSQANKGQEMNLPLWTAKTVPG